MKLGRQHNYHKGRAALRIYANQPARPLWHLCRHPNFTSTYRGVNARLALCLNSVLNVKAKVMDCLQLYSWIFTALMVCLSKIWYNNSHKDLLLVSPNFLSEIILFICPAIRSVVVLLPRGDFAHKLFAFDPITSGRLGLDQSYFHNSDKDNMNWSEQNRFFSMIDYSIKVGFICIFNQTQHDQEWFW